MGIKRIYTRSGDKGMTGIHGGSRVPKTDIRIEANGSLDELNVAIGCVRSFMAVEDERQEQLRNIQLSLMSLMSIVATPDAIRDKNPNKLPDNFVEEIEKLIDCYMEKCSDTDYFVLPGGTPVASFLQQCRVAARRAERRLWELNEKDPVPDFVTSYVNRLSDLFFIMARAETQEKNLGEDRWKLFSYKRKQK